MSKYWIVTGAILLTAAIVWSTTGRQHVRDGNQIATTVPSIPDVRLPRQDLDGGYASALACKKCHPKEFESWHGSYHRTMTQVVSPDTVAAPIHDEVLESRGRIYRFQERDGRFFVTMADIEQDVVARRLGMTLPSGERKVSKELVMSTGSHHYQTYWVNGSRGNQLWQVPWIYHLADQRWIPVEDAFLVPPGDHRRLTDWNDNCIQCHAVRGQPRYVDSQALYDTGVADLGIACEACHGPGAQHVAFHESKEAENAPRRDTIVNPVKLMGVRSSQVCGQCHSSFHVDDVEGFLEAGLRFRPGDDLAQCVTLNRLDHSRVQASAEARSGFWDDGSIRLAGREFSGFSESRCFMQGEATCFSCHSMHSYEQEDDQLSVHMRTDQACLQCHGEYQDRVREHTHHPPESAGARCYNCHMPHTSFGLFKSVRSHQINSPSALSTMQYGKPNACNLCHLDKTLAWTASHLTSWFGQDVLPTDETTAKYASAASMLLKGDAVQRVIAAWHFGQEASMAASGDCWQVPLLAELLNDGYAVIRYVAGKSIHRYPGMESLEYDFIAPEEQRTTFQAEAVRIWSAMTEKRVPESPRAVFLTVDGKPDRSAIRRVREERDDRPLILPE